MASFSRSTYVHLCTVTLRFRQTRTSMRRSGTGERLTESFFRPASLVGLPRPLPHLDASSRRPALYSREVTAPTPLLGKVVLPPLNAMCSNTSVDRNSFLTFTKRRPIDRRLLGPNYDEALPLSLSRAPRTRRSETRVNPKLQCQEEKKRKAGK